MRRRRLSKLARRVGTPHIRTRAAKSGSTTTRGRRTPCGATMPRPVLERAEPRRAPAAPSNNARTTSSWSSPAHDEQHSTNTARRSWARQALVAWPISVETRRKCGIKGAHFDASRSQQPLNTETSKGSFADASPSSFEHRLYHFLAASIVPTRRRPAPSFLARRRRRSTLTD